MATSRRTVRRLNEQELRDLVSAKLVDLGCACAPDLAGQIGFGVTADDLLPILKSLADEGVLRHKEKDPRDPRDYKPPYQTVYEPNYGQRFRG